MLFMYAACRTDDGAEKESRERAGDDRPPPEPAKAHSDTECKLDVTGTNAADE